MTRSQRNASWEDYDYPLAVGEELAHQLTEDIRKRLWLILIGPQTTTALVNEPTLVDNGGKTYRCKVPHTSAAISEPGSGASWANYWVLHSEIGGFGDAWADATFYDVGWAGTNGGFRQGDAFNDYGSGPSSEVQRGPFFVDVWYEGRWGNSIDEAGANAYDLIGATQDHDGVGYSELWFTNSTIHTPAGGNNETVFGNLLPGCPILVSGVNADTAEANGYWRIKSSRRINDSGGDYVLVRLEDFHEENEFVLLNDRSYAGGYSKGGEAACDFGGDWYAFCPRASIDGNVDFVDDKDMIHKATDNARCDDEWRPPDGGKFSRNNSRYWIRTTNRYRYHHYDRNAMRWVGMSQTRLAVDYFTIVESWRMLPIQTDPKERVPPHWYANTDRLAWNIAGNKVEIQKAQLTDFPTMLAAQGSQTEQEVDPPNNVKTSSETYRTVTWDGSSNFVTGSYPPFDNDSKWHKQREIWREYKYDSRCLWAWIEIAAQAGNFIAEVNAAYKTNWLDCNRLTVDPVDGVDTYETLWHDSGGWDLAGYRPQENSAQPAHDLLTSKYWGENESAIEKVLSDIDAYDWWYDIENIYVPYDIKDFYGNILFGEANNHNDPPDSGDEAAAEWEAPTPHGTWRKIPKYTLGYVDGAEAIDPGVTGFMRDYESGTPDGVEIGNYISLVHNSLQKPLAENEWWHFNSLYSKQAPAVGEFGNYATNLLERHGPVHIHNSVDYYERAVLVLQHMIDVLDQLIYKDLTGSVGITKKGAQISGDDEVEGFDDEDLPKNWASANQFDLSHGWDAWARKYIESDMSLWPNAAGYDLEWDKDTEYWGGDLPWEWQEPPDYQEAAFKFTNFAKVAGLAEIYLNVEIEESTVTVTETSLRQLGIIAGIGANKYTQPNFGEGTYYFSILATTVLSTTENLQYVRVWLDNFAELREGVPPPVVPDWEGIIRVNLDIHAKASISIIGLFNWDYVPDAAWIRDDTYACKKLLDPTKDEKPPVHEPIAFFQKPTIYDANRPQGDADGVCYLSAFYTAEFRIKMVSILMEDLEGNGEEYDFVGSEGSGTPSAGNGDFDALQEDHRYDEILDMGVGSSSDDGGTTTDLAEAFVNDLQDWAFKVRAKDDASAAGAGQTDNYTAFSDVEEVVAEEDTICSPTGLWEIEPIADSAGDVDMILYPAFGPEGDREVEYRFTASGWDTGWQDSNSATHSSAALPKTYIGYARTKTGEITQHTSEAITVS